MADLDELRALIQELAVVHGRVTLSSGQEADWYIDLRRVTLHHAGAPLVGRVMLELKAMEAVSEQHRAQLLSYLRVSGLKLGLLINFHVFPVVKGIHRVVNKL